MDVDWDKSVPNDAVGKTASVIMGSSRSGLETVQLESTRRGARDSAADSGVPAEKDRLARLSGALEWATSAMPEGKRAVIKEKVIDGARTGLAKLYQDDSKASFTLGEHVALEAVILTNGERPSLFVKDGYVNTAAPDIGTWDQDLGRVRNQINKVAAAVGRIDVPVRPWFAGTCFVISTGYVLTNRHVLEEIAVQDSAGAWKLNWPDETTVDFVGEDGKDVHTKFKVTGVAFAGPDPIERRINFAHLDAAVLYVDATSDKTQPFPEPVTFGKDVLQPKSRRDLYVLGFPGQPKTWLFDGTPPAGFETSQVLSEIFNSKFGVKRLAPGVAKSGAAQVAGDAQKWICSHDASTLGGNSGSCIVDLAGDGMRIVGLHFGGANREENWAHVAARLKDVLAQFSPNFV